MLEFNSDKLDVKVNGKVYQVDFPSFEQGIKYAQQVKDVEEEAAPMKLIDFLDDLGLPKEISMKMQSNHIEQLVAALLPSKKK
jgi:hypothetical protein